MYLGLVWLLVSEVVLKKVRGEGYNRLVEEGLELLVLVMESVTDFAKSSLAVWQKVMDYLRGIERAILVPPHILSERIVRKSCKRCLGFQIRL